MNGLKWSPQTPELKSSFNKIPTEKAAVEQKINNFYLAVDARKEQLLQETLRRRRAFKLSRILERVTSMAIDKFATEMEYDNVDQFGTTALTIAGQDDDIKIYLNRK